jgi:hypothetical protein
MPKIAESTGAAIADVRAPGRAVRAALSSGILFLVLASSPVVAVAHDAWFSRDLHCQRFQLPRSREICRALGREMEWTWTGHAIISTGYRVTWDTLRRVFCTVHVEPGDTVALVALVVWYRKGEGSDSRLEFGATGLLKMMGKRAVVALPASGSMPSEMTNLRLRHLKDDLELTSSDERFIFHPSNPQYILRDGCPK